MDDQIEQLTVIRDLAQRRAEAAEIALAAVKRRAQMAEQRVAAADEQVSQFDAARPGREAEMRKSLEHSTDVRSADIFAMQAGMVGLTRERDELIAHVRQEEAARDAALASIRPAAAAAQKTRARAEKLHEALKEIAAEAALLDESAEFDA
jgi:hypothetical protein